MRTRRSLLAATAIFAAIAASPCVQARTLFEAEPVTVRPDGLSGEAAVIDLLRTEGYGDAALGSLTLTRRHVSPTTGRTYLTYQQELGGLLVYGSTVRATLEEDGTLSQVIHRIADVTDARAVLAARTAADTYALAKAAGAAFGRPAPSIKTLTADELTFDGGTFFEEDPKANRVLVADEDGVLSHGFLVQSWSKADNQLVHTLVGGDGRTLSVEQRSSSDSYVAFRTNPTKGNPTVMGGWMADGTASPRGWLRADLTQKDIHIRGDNVEAYLDRDGNGVVDGGGRVVTNGTFQTIPQLSQDAASYANQRAAVQSAFVHVNQMHDRLYKHGFTETAGNFQRDNHGRGGRAGDYVRVEVLDGGGTNNANFSTPMYAGLKTGDGGAPRMQMYKWTRASPHRAGSLDADVMWHEYAHGVIWRMVGDLDKPIAWAVNEGFADALAVVATNDSALGEWAANRAAGLRSAPYKGYSRTVSSYKAGKRHQYYNAEIFAATMWRFKELMNAGGRSDDRVMDLMIDGLANTSPAPDFLDMRDGLLAAARGADDCRVWQAFAQFGMGDGARMSWSGSTGNPSVRVVESRRVPSGCGAAQPQAAPPAPAPAPAPTSGWQKCADETGACRVSTGTTVRYGANGKYRTRTLSGSFSCSNATFGDPAPGVRKACYVPTGASTAPAGQKKCADEGGACRVTTPTRVRYGANGKFYTRTLSGSFACSSSTFGGDPIRGVRKACYVPAGGTTYSGEQKCADEGGVCRTSSKKTIRYGANGRFYARTLSGTVPCNNATFGDPTPGVRKACYVKN